MSSCFAQLYCCGSRRADFEDEERRPLLPQYHDDTSMQAALHSKVHTYQMLRALGRGYIPSNEQTIVNLRTLLASGLLNPDRSQNGQLSESGRAVVHYARKVLGDFIELLQHKNAGDQIQDFIWYISHGVGLTVDVDDIAKRASKARSRANTTAGNTVPIPNLFNSPATSTPSNSPYLSSYLRRPLAVLSAAPSLVSSGRRTMAAVQNRQAYLRARPTAYRSVQTVGSLLLTNPDFRVFLSDIATVGREVFSDTALKLSTVSREAAERLEPSQQERESLLRKHEGEASGTANGGGSTKAANGKQPQQSQQSQPPTEQTLGEEVTEVANVLAEGATEVAGEAKQSLTDHLQGEEKEALFDRLRRAVASLRKRPDYSASVSTISLLLQRYALAYSHAVQDTVEAATEDVRVDETGSAMSKFWALVRSFGDAAEWEALEGQFRQVMERGRAEDQDFDEMVRQLGRAVQEMLTEPEFFHHAEERLEELRDQSRNLTSRSSLEDEIDAFLAKLKSTFRSVLKDNDVARLTQTLVRLGRVVAPPSPSIGGGISSFVNADLAADLINVFVPTLLRAVRYVPIPRLEISTPDVDLLLENLILEPGSEGFLPNKLRVETRNDLEVRQQGRSRTTSIVAIEVDGLSLAAEDVGFWMRTRAWLPSILTCLAGQDEGIASLRLGENGGIDIRVEVEVGRDALDQLLALRSVSAAVRGLDYTVRKSRIACCAWLFKPFFKPILRLALERSVEAAVADAVVAANRELLFARERLRATRVAAPADWVTFVRAVAARFVPEPDPDLQARVGIVEGDGVFKGVYAPGSLVKIWNEEAARAGDRIREYERDGWRNGIFDVQTVPAMER